MNENRFSRRRKKNIQKLLAYRNKNDVPISIHYHQWPWIERKIDARLAFEINPIEKCIKKIHTQQEHTAHSTIERALHAHFIRTHTPEKESQTFWENQERKKMPGENNQKKKKLSKC